MTDVPDFQKAVAIAAKWWADQLRGTPKFDNGEPLQNAFMAWHASLLPKPSAEQIATFETVLRDALLARVGTQHPRWAFECRVDYHPDQPLTDAARVAGFNPDFLLPCKTTTWIEDDGRVFCRNGYAADKVELSNG